MNIKIGDMVIYEGQTTRFMKYSDSTIRLSYFGDVGLNINDLPLAKSITLPDLKVGDLVTIDDIPKEEKDNYVVWWNKYKEFMVKSNAIFKIQKVERTKYHGLIFKISDEWFSAYHVIPVPDYDMI